jgi:LacI family transcriptional regulator
MDAWQRYLTDLGAAPASDRLIVIEQGNTIEAIELAERAAAGLFRAKSIPSAIFACNDLMAMGVLKAAAREGIAVPGELSVVGHDNTILSMSGHTQLTSVDLKMRSLGAAAVDLLIHAIKGTDLTLRRVLINPELVVRESTGPVNERTRR